MKKEFLDYLYELRASLQLDIDRLVERQKDQRDGNATEKDWDCELRMRRGEIGVCNKTIEKYLQIHKL